jgi:hypothetical protein
MFFHLLLRLSTFSILRQFIKLNLIIIGSSDMFRGVENKQLLLSNIGILFE